MLLIAQINVLIQFSLVMVKFERGPKYGGIPHARRNECAKIKTSQSHFSNRNFGRK